MSYCEDSRIDTNTRMMLSMIEVVIHQIGQTAKLIALKPALLRGFMKDLVEFNTKLKGYKEMKDERED